MGFGVLLLGTAAVVASVTTGPADAQVQVGDLSVSSVNQTVDGAPSDVTLDADLRYSISVPDAESRVVKLKAGPSEDTLETITFASSQNPDTGGSVTLSGSLLDTQAYSSEDFAPDMAETSETTVVVQAKIEVTRANGETVTETVTRTATVTLHDSTTLTADIGGSVDVTVAE
jgi:hypothetical protein